MNDELISVITVAKNAEKTIRATIDSVLSQTYRNIEYICIVGECNDKTNIIIDEYKKQFDLKGVRLKHVSGPDSGIYDAMNKGSELASGQWLYFLNADDRLCDGVVFQRIFAEKHIYDETDCVYGNIILCSDGKFVIRKGAPVSAIYYKFPICHQAAFVRKSIIKKYGFNEEYKRLADFDQFFRMYLDNRIFKYVDVDVAYFSTDGVSQKNNIALAIEREKIHKKLGISRKKRIRRWVRYFFICVIKDNRLFYKCFFGIDYWIQKIKNIH